MKNLIKLFVLLIILASCNTEKSKIDTNIEAYFKKYAHNPDTYEPISTKFQDTIFVLDGINRNIEAFKDSPDEYGINTLNECKQKKDSILNSNDKNPIIGYLYIHSCRINVPLGGKMLKDIEVLTNINFDIIAANEIKY